MGALKGQNRGLKNNLLFLCLTFCLARSVPLWIPEMDQKLPPWVFVCRLIKLHFWQVLVPTFLFVHHNSSVPVCVVNLTGPQRWSYPSVCTWNKTKHRAPPSSLLTWRNQYCLSGNFRRAKAQTPTLSSQITAQKERDTQLHHHSLERVEIIYRMNCELFSRVSVFSEVTSGWWVPERGQLCSYVKGKSLLCVCSWNVSVCVLCMLSCFQISALCEVLKGFNQQVLSSKCWWAGCYQITVFNESGSLRVCVRRCVCMCVWFLSHKWFCIDCSTVGVFVYGSCVIPWLAAYLSLFSVVLITAVCLCLCGVSVCACARVCVCLFPLWWSLSLCSSVWPSELIQQQQCGECLWLWTQHRSPCRVWVWARITFYNKQYCRCPGNISFEMCSLHLECLSNSLFLAQGAQVEITKHEVELQTHEEQFVWDIAQLLMFGEESG